MMLPLLFPLQVMFIRIHRRVSLVHNLKKGFHIADLFPGSEFRGRKLDNLHSTNLY